MCVGDMPGLMFQLHMRIPEVYALYSTHSVCDSNGEFDMSVCIRDDRDHGRITQYSQHCALAMDNFSGALLSELQLTAGQGDTSTP